MADLVTDKIRFLQKKKKEIGGPNLGQMSQNQAQNHAQNQALRSLCPKWFFMIKFDSLVFLEIAYYDSLQ